MVLYILQTLLVTYFLGVALFGTIFVVALSRVGGWDDFCSQANLFAGKEMFTVKSIRTACIFIVFCWPVLPIMLSKSKRS